MAYGQNAPSCDPLNLNTNGHIKAYVLTAMC